MASVRPGWTQSSSHPKRTVTRLLHSRWAGLGGRRRGRQGDHGGSKERRGWRGKVPVPAWGDRRFHLTYYKPRKPQLHKAREPPWALRQQNMQWGGRPLPLQRGTPSATGGRVAAPWAPRALGKIRCQEEGAGSVCCQGQQKQTSCQKE